MSCKILYFHGLNSCLHADRREVLEQYGQVEGPDFDYEKERIQIFDRLWNHYSDADIIVGSSAGGLVGYLFSWMLDVPCFVFNPALPHLKEIPHFPLPQKSRTALLYVLAGGSDEIVNANKTFQILKEHNSPQSKFSFHYYQELSHNVPIDVFERETHRFFELLKIK